MKIPYMLVVGAKEVEQGTVAVNVRGAGEKQKANPVALDQKFCHARKSRKSETRAADADSRDTRARMNARMRG